MKKITEDKKGYSLLEMIVAIAMFSVIFLMVTSVYLSLLKMQRSVIATQTIQESLKFVLETVSKEVRTAQKSDNSCAVVLGLTSDDGVGLENKIYNEDSSTTNTLYFMNADGECVAYFLEDDADGISRFKINRDNVEMYVTPNELDIANLDFNILDDDVDAFHSMQPTVTIKLDVTYVGSRAEYGQNTSLQTSITSRAYE